MSRSTFKTAKQSRIQQAIGKCSSKTEFASVLNEAQERLITRGHWKGSFQRVRICLDEGCFTLPRGILGLSNVSVCGDPIQGRNQWSEFLSGSCSSTFNDCLCDSTKMTDRGFHPTFRDIKYPNKKLRVYLTDLADAGKKVHIFGWDDNGNFIRTSDKDGFELTLASPFVDSTFTVKSITGVQKEETKGQVLVYSLDTVTGAEAQLGIYEPTETVADYRRYSINSFSAESCPAVRTIEGIAKLDFIPVRNDWDYLYIDNIPALKEMCQAIRYLESDTPRAKQNALLHENRAIKELNHQKENITPNSSIPISMRVMGSADLRNKRIGKLT